ncbi:DUF134 domain-containing protein [Thermohalobacter berrensis]|uniref:UPF0251 protein BET03_10220 n=1 Tax=Thermohalobacter berrensis TaxID=99594 RepID=A0A419T691_9FIRM|nr:DUF134 domain-containing protein [Thermohalobacter berrensis]RKD32981.1 hypothetical protein BET03_10220 [Thermohalobacter berrensis]
MPRPVKWRRVEIIPEYKHFKPSNIPACELEENILKIEELEAVRLKDLEGLDQESCAERMAISRQTFQRIYNSAKKKIADSLVNGKAIRIRGGNYTRNLCTIKCNECGNEWESRVEDIEENQNNEKICPECGSTDLYCKEKENNRYCRHRCRRRKGRR